MAESGSLRKPQKLILSDSDMATAAAAAAAAQQLMQLSDEDNNSSEKCSDVKKEKEKKKSLDDEEAEDYAQSKEEINWAKKIEEIFGKEEEEEEVEIYQPKKRRFRTLVSLYRATKPMPLDMHRKKMRC